MKNKGFEYNKWIFQDLEKLIQVKMWKKKHFSRAKRSPLEEYCGKYLG